MNEANASALTLALRQLGHRLGNDEQALHAIVRRIDGIERSQADERNEAREDRRETRERFDGFEVMLRESVKEMRDCGKRDHDRLDKRLDAIDAKVSLHDDMLDDVAIMAAEKHGRGMVGRVIGRGVKWFGEHTGVVQFGFGFVIAAIAPVAWTMVNNPVQAAPVAEPAPVAEAGFGEPVEPLELRGPLEPR